MLFRVVQLQRERVLKTKKNRDYQHSSDRKRETEGRRDTERD